MDKLNLRLQTAAEFVKEGSIAADVGTDHGYLICYLVNEGIVKHGFATDSIDTWGESLTYLV